MVEYVGVGSVHEWISMLMFMPEWIFILLLIG
jgi:hypothetical protein